MLQRNLKNNKDVNIIINKTLTFFFIIYVKPNNNKPKKMSLNLKRDKASDKLNLKLKTLTNKLNNNLIDLDIIFVKIEGINDNKRLGKKRLKHTLKKELEKIVANERQKLEHKVRLLKPKSILFNEPINHEEEIKKSNSPCYHALLGFYLCHSKGYNCMLFFQPHSYDFNLKCH